MLLAVGTKAALTCYTLSSHLHTTGNNVTPQTLKPLVNAEEDRAKLTDALVLKVFKKGPNDTMWQLV